MSTNASALAATVLNAAARSMDADTFASLATRCLLEFARRQRAVGTEAALREAEEWHPMAPAFILAATEALAEAVGS